MLVGAFERAQRTAHLSQTHNVDRPVSVLLVFCDLTRNTLATSFAVYFVSLCARIMQSFLPRLGERPLYLLLYTALLLTLFAVAFYDKVDALERLNGELIASRAELETLEQVRSAALALLAFGRGALVIGRGVTDTQHASLLVVNGGHCTRGSRASRV